MNYQKVTHCYPEVRAQEYELLSRLGINAATQYPNIDPTVRIPTHPDIGLSFINLHHLPPKQVAEEIINLNFNTYYAIEIVQGSAQACFLDNYVGRFRVGGHRGCYIHPNYFPQATNYSIEYNEYCYHWYFDPALAVEYCDRLFNIKSDKLIDALTHYLNYDDQKIDWKVGALKLSKK